MKRILLFMALFCVTTLNAINNYTNQTFMFPKEIFGSFGMYQASWHNIVYNKKSYGFALQAYAYGQSSLANTTNASEYFLFNDLESLVVQSGTGAAFDEQSFTRNIAGPWLGIKDSTPITASYSLTPQQSQYGITLGFNQDLSKFCDMGFLRALSFGFSVPIVHVKNQLIYSGNQEVLNALQGGGNENFSPAIYDSWDNLVLDSNVQETTTVAIIKFQFDTKYQSEDDIQIATTTFFLAPAAASVTNETLFQPMLGYNGHNVMGSSITFQFPLSVSQDELSRICMYFGLENKFLFGNNQNRTVEIYGNPYSRYLPLYDRYASSDDVKVIVPGVNAFTRNCYVEPYNIINFIAGFRLKFKESVAEIGYELWGKDTEQITINSNNLWQDDRYGIANINGECVLDPTIQTASQSTINYVVPDTVENVYIKAKDLTMLTGEGRATIINRVYSSIGYGHSNDYRDIFVNLGLFMEICQNNAAVSNWGGWLKSGFTF